MSDHPSSLTPAPSPPASPLAFLIPLVLLGALLLAIPTSRVWLLKPLIPVLPAEVAQNLGLTPTARLADDAQRLYDQVWSLLATEYLEPEMNHQDWDRWRRHYARKLGTLDDAYVAIDTMVESLNDPYTRFLTPKQVSDQEESIRAELFGVGLQIAEKDGKVMVVTPIEGSPAEKAGIIMGDQIVTVNGQSVAALPVDKVAEKIRGPKGTPVKLGLLRQGKKLEKNLIRDAIHIKAVHAITLKNHPDIGYIQLSSFISERASDELADQFRKLEGKRAFILDLRDNYGGLLQNAIEIADMFLDTGPIVSVVDRQPEETHRFNARPGQITRKPLVILTNGASASASEILSGALKDHRRATLIGERTFGKGLVQKIVPLANNAGINVTIARYLTPNGTDIHKKGIQPNITVKMRLRPEDLALINRQPDLMRREPERVDRALQKALDVLKTPTSPAS
jgi:carboxyl-terminal processing protease